MSRAGGGLVACAMLDAIAQKEGAYKEGIKENHAHCTGTATRLNKEGGDIEDILMMMTEASEGKDALISEQEVQAFMEEQRNRLKKLAEQNVERERTVDTFVSAVRDLRQKILSASSNDPAVTDYEDQLKALMDKHEKSRQASQLEIHQETYFRETMDALGEKDEFAPKAGDDDIEVVMSGNKTVSLKCPVTSALFQDPVKNKACGHVYSRVGIDHLLKSSRGRCNCPVAGCTNGNVNSQQLEPDVTMATLVRREKRRQDATAKARASQAANVDESDEEEF